MLLGLKQPEVLELFLNSAAISAWMLWNHDWRDYYSVFLNRIHYDVIIMESIVDSQDRLHFFEYL